MEFISLSLTTERGLTHTPITTVFLVYKQNDLIV